MATHPPLAADPTPTYASPLSFHMCEVVVRACVTHGRCVFWRLLPSHAPTYLVSPVLNSKRSQPKRRRRSQRDAFVFPRLWLDVFPPIPISHTHGCVHDRIFYCSHPGIPLFKYLPTVLCYFFFPISASQPQKPIFAEQIVYTVKRKE